MNKTDMFIRQLLITASLQLIQWVWNWLSEIWSDMKSGKSHIVMEKEKPVATERAVWWTECHFANSFNTLLIHYICIRLLHVLFLASFVLILRPHRPSVSDKTCTPKLCLRDTAGWLECCVSFWKYDKNLQC